LHNFSTILRQEELFVRGKKSSDGAFEPTENQWVQISHREAKS